MPNTNDEHARHLARRAAQYLKAMVVPRASPQVPIAYKEGLRQAVSLMIQELIKLNGGPDRDGPGADDWIAYRQSLLYTEVQSVWYCVMNLSADSVPFPFSVYDVVDAWHSFRRKPENGVNKITKDEEWNNFIGHSFDHL